MFGEQEIKLDEFESFDWDITFVTVEEQIFTIDLYKQESQFKLPILTYSLRHAVHKLHYHSGYSPEEVILRVDKKSLEKLIDPEQAKNVLQTGVIVTFVSPQTTDSGYYLFEIKGRRLDTGAEFSKTLKAKVSVGIESLPLKIDRQGKSSHRHKLCCNIQVCEIGKY